MEFVRNMERRRLIKPQDILATLQSIPEDESESELQEHVFDSDSDEDLIPQNISSESEDSEGTNPEDIPSTSTGDRAHAVMLPRDHPPGRGQKKSAKRPRNERTTDNDGGEGNATTNTREGESEGILVSTDEVGCVVELVYISWQKKKNALAPELPKWLLQAIDLGEFCIECEPPTKRACICDALTAFTSFSVSSVESMANGRNHHQRRMRRTHCNRTLVVHILLPHLLSQSLM
ncbi:uncharacterized protein LOC143803673 [Ranitomeya variabilis]|uniref:uncharacterized protein LOC143803673 n=1 Tax=Ranitomeya variabilis TaxID=490064 RepID=UPI0040569CE6